MDCSLPDSSVHGILQARILEWVATSFSREPSQPRDWTHVSCVSCIASRLYHLTHQGSPNLRINWSKIQARYILSWSPDTVSPLNPCVWHPWFQPAMCGLASMVYQSHEYRGPAVLDGEGNGTPLQYSCLENPMDGGAWWAAVHGVA